MVNKISAIRFLIEECYKNFPELIEEIPMGRFGNGDEVANTVVFLCQNDISYLTGQIIKIDGGFL